jgi:hypothetical protein
VSDFVLSVIPTDPYWQPGQAAADRCTALATRYALPDGGPGTAVEVDWYDAVTVVDAGENLARITCPACHATIPVPWFLDILQAQAGHGFEDLARQVPCCHADLPLDTLGYDWPCGFASFEIAVWNSSRAEFTGTELQALGTALGHAVHQIRSHV